MFNCVKCGLCCASVGRSVGAAKKMDSTEPLIQEIANFPYKYDKSGRCENLTEDNLCKVYDNRPDMCNVEKIYEKYFSKQFAQDEWYKKNESHCQILIERNNFVNAELHLKN